MKVATLRSSLFQGYDRKWPFPYERRLHRYGSQSTWQLLITLHNIYLVTLQKAKPTVGGQKQLLLGCVAQKALVIS